MTDLRKASTGTLINLESKLIDGLDLVVESLENGTFNKAGEKGEASPFESGNLTLALLIQVSHELDKRGVK